MTKDSYLSSVLVRAASLGSWAGHLSCGAFSLLPRTIRMATSSLSSDSTRTSAGPYETTSVEPGARCSIKSMTKPDGKPRTHCPNCNSKQRFLPKSHQYMTNGKPQVRVFIRCDMCRWEAIVYDGPKGLYGLRYDMSRLHAAESRRSVPDVQKKRLAQRAERLANEQ